VRQLALETLLVAFAGGAVGLLLARAALAIIPDLVPPSIPFLTLPVLDARVAVFAFALALVASVIVSGWPIATFVRSAPLPRGAALRPRRLVHRALVVSQIALTVALVAVARLLEQSLETVRRQDPGFTIDRVLVAQVGLTTQARLPPERVVASEERLLNAIAARPQVHAVASAYDHPLEANWSETPAVTGDTSAEDQRHPSELRIVSPGYFEALDVPLLDGRTFSDRDRFDGPGVAVVNEAFARIVGGRVLGRRVRSETPRFLYGVGAANEFEIVGIVRNERFRGLEQPALPAFYLSTRQFPQTTVTLLVKTIAEPLSVAADIRAAIRSVDPAITVDRPTTLDAIAADQLVSRRVTTDVIGSFATSALVLAALGMYALLAVMVGTRTREIGIRLAVGASPASVGREVMGDCLRSAAVGVVLGTGLALLSGQFIQSLLVDVSPRDPGTLGAVAAVLLIVAASAAVIPACRAARIDPVETLRAD
jgi:predicted permease